MSVLISVSLILKSISANYEDFIRKGLYIKPATTFWEKIPFFKERNK